MLLKNFRSKLILMVYAIILLFCNILYNTDLSANELIIYEKQGFSSKFQDINSKELDLKNFEGKLILVNLWATWCEPCKEEMPSRDRLQKNLKKIFFKFFLLA
jgi:thiol-disulfide isomerase/thioredoxin